MSGRTSFSTVPLGNFSNAAFVSNWNDIRPFLEITDAELTKAKAQLRARLVFDSDSVSNIAHQLGYYETIATADLFSAAPAAIAAVTLDEVANAARTLLTPSNRTVGYFDPIRITTASGDVRSATASDDAGSATALAERS